MKKLKCKICNNTQIFPNDLPADYYICSSKCADIDFFNKEKSKNQKIIKFEGYLDIYPDKKPTKYYSPLEMKIGCVVGEFYQFPFPPGIKYKKYEVTLKLIEEN